MATSSELPFGTAPSWTQRPLGTPVLLLTMAVVSAALSMALTLKVDVVVNAQGTFDTGTRPVALQAPFSGSIASIAKPPGSAVLRGDLILNLDTDGAVDDVEGALILLREKEARRRAVASVISDLKNSLRAGSSFLNGGVDGAAIQSQLIAVAEARKARFAELEAARADLAGAEAKRSVGEQARIKREFLIARGLLPTLDSAVVAAARADDNAKVSVAAASVRRAESALKDARGGNTRTLRAAYLQYAEEDRRLASEIAQSKHNLMVAAQYRERSKILAPFAGTVEEIEPLFVRRNLTKSELMFRIVPHGTLRGFRALVPNESVGTIGIGDPVRIRIPALPFSRYGTV